MSPSPHCSLSATRILGAVEIAALVGVDDYFLAARAAFAHLGNGTISNPEVGHLAGQGGTIHIKSAVLTVEPFTAAIKLNANFPGNPRENGLPTIQGVIVLFDSRNGRVLALLDSIEVTARRTAAASAVAARFLGRAAASRLALVGCGVQAAYHLEAFLAIFPVEEVRCFDHDLSAAQELAERAAAKGLRSFVADSCRAAALGADLVVTATTAREAFLGLDDILPGTFIAAVGADNPHKAEIKGELMAAARVIPDLRSQASSMGDSRAAVAAGAISLDDLEVELADLVLGRSLGRESDEEITIFDSTGTAALDLMAAQAIFEAAGL